MRFTLSELPAEVLAGGVERRRTAGEQLELIVYDYPPGAVFAEHHHEAEQLTIVLTGTLVFRLGGREERLEAGEALLIPGSEPHGAFVPEDAGDTRTINVFTPVRKKLPGGA